MLHAAPIIMEVGSHLKLTLPPLEATNCQKVFRYWSRLMDLPASMLECWLVWSCVDNHSCCEFMNKAVLSCPEDTALLLSSWASGLTISPSSLLRWFPSLEELVSYECPICGWALHKHLLSAPWPVVFELAASTKQGNVSDEAWVQC